MYLDNAFYSSFAKLKKMTFCLSKKSGLLFLVLLSFVVVGDVVGRVLYNT